VGWCGLQDMNKTPSLLRNRVLDEPGSNPAGKRGKLVSFLLRMKASRAIPQKTNPCGFFFVSWLGWAKLSRL